MTEKEMLLKEERDALMLFISERPYGNHLRDVAERRLVDLNELEMINSMEGDIKFVKRGNGVRACIDKSTGTLYTSMKLASEAINITYRTLTSDIYKEKYKYNIYQL